ncbi:HDL271Wp [Eremothecium sinecaudum]|uniref:Kynurenine 3-monooxygenase n=1 Tax=Eremothecium sinecaudum TaxID=45286 RepID=A0A109UYS9_9SACH|nr:HDL271Wp [Eremothecium sinecaudum]AMD20473.1 HDL271Wp [Eremothecium sinecaudum]
MSEGNSVAVIGSGLVGCFAALALQRKGYNVSLFDYREDPREKPNNEGNLRSINLVVSARGIEALTELTPDILEPVLQDSCELEGRMIHKMNGSQERQIYGLFGETLQAVDRFKLNNRLLDEITKVDDIKVYFQHKLRKLDLYGEKVIGVFETEDDNIVEYEFDFALGCDGAYSTSRSQLQRYTRMDYAQDYMDCFYVHLSIPPADEKGTPKITPNYLHIWPRTDHMLIAIVNPDGSFTSTFFGPWRLASELNSREKIKSFLMDNFPDAMELMGIENALDAFENNIKGALMCVQCHPYHSPDGKMIILGDAAHSMVPFYGQGMNCGFEDVRILLQLLEKHEFNRVAAFEEYSATRHKDLVAITQLAKDNYYEMSHNVATKLHMFKMKLNWVLGKVLRDGWLPLYTMVSFRAEIPYHKAIAINRRQNLILKFVQTLLVPIIAFGGYKSFVGIYGLVKKISKQ